MKTSPFIVALLLSTSSVFAQGALLFANYGAGVNVPISDGLGHRLNGPGFAADIYWAPGTVTDSTVLTALRQPARFSTNGYFLGGERTILGAGAWSTITVQVRVWNAAYFESWESALVGLFPQVEAAYLGMSPLFQVSLSGPPYTPSSLTGLPPFHAGMALDGCKLPVSLQIVADTNTITLTWPAYECDGYVVQQNPTLYSDNWLTLTNDHVLVGLTNQVEDQLLLPAPAGTMFYRLVWQ